MQVQINTPKKLVNINTPKTDINLGVQRINTGGVKQVYIGNTEPTDPNILIWIDTSDEPIVIDKQLITVDNMEFITANNEKFILKEE